MTTNSLLYRLTLLALLAGFLSACVGTTRQNARVESRVDNRVDRRHGVYY